MAQVQQRPGFPMPDQLNRPQYGSQLPSIDAVQQDPHLGQHRFTLPPIQLPPIPSSRSQTSPDVLSITSLLSRNPDSPRERSIPSGPIPQRSVHPQSQSFARPPIEAYNHAGAYAPTTLSEPRRYFDDAPPTPHPPMPYMQPQHHMSRQLSYGAHPHPADQAQHSPSTSTHSFGGGRYNSSTEPSPTTSAARPNAFHAQPRASQPPRFNYNLLIRQQPAAARACGFGERDRRVIDPPPILELKITDPVTGAPEQDPYAMLALHCTLLSQDGKEDETEVQPTEKGMPTTRRLMGTLVASPYQAKDENDDAGTFFVFPDLSCRSPGKYRLRFKLLRVDPTNMVPGAIHGSVASIVTDVFSVYTAKDFPGMRASSALLKALRRQGLNVGVKKGSEARKGRSRAKKESSSEDEEDGSEIDEERRGSGLSKETDSDVDMSPHSKPQKKGKRRKREQ